MFLSEVGIRYEIRKGDIAWNLWKNGHKLRNIDRGNKFIPLAPTLPQIAHTLSKTFLPYLVGEIGSLFSAVIACTRVSNGYDFEAIYTYDNERLLVTIEQNSFEFQSPVRILSRKLSSMLLFSSWSSPRCSRLEARILVRTFAIKVNDTMKIRGTKISMKEKNKNRLL